MHTTRTLQLSQKWDIELTGTGRISLRRDEIATAQAVANEVRRFFNDSYFDYNIGIPHFNVELGHILPDVILRSYIRLVINNVADVAEVLEINVVDVDRETRVLTGDIRFKTQSGVELTIAL